MVVMMKFDFHAIVQKIATLLLVGTLSSALACGQSGPGQAPAYVADLRNVPDAIARLKSGDFAAVHVDMIARAGAVDAIPILKEQFVLNQDELLKGKISAALLKLGNKEDVYWDYLEKLATPALESDAPDFMSYDAAGNSQPGPSQEFVAWAKAHNVTPNGPDNTAAEDSVYIFPGKVLLLAWSGDSRAIPLLRRALISPNHMIQIAAAEGLAGMQDKDSIPLIVEACKRAPVEAAARIATSLVYFDDPGAQSAVDQYVPKDIVKTYRQARAQGEKRTPWD